MADYIPKSEHRRHQLYIGAFCRSQSKTEYIAYITKFLFDPEISPKNEDDMELFKDLIFESRHGKIHIEYYSQQFWRLKGRKRIRVIRRLARYAEFLSLHSEMFLEDMYHCIYRNHPDIIGDLLDALPSRVKVPFVMLAERYPVAIQQVPKLKFYMTFS